MMMNIMKNIYLELKSNIDNQYGSNGKKRKIDFDKNSSFIETKSIKISRKCINYNRDKIKQSQNKKFIIYPTNKDRFSSNIFYIIQEEKNLILEKYNDILEETNKCIDFDGNIYIGIKASFKQNEPQCLQLAEGICIREPNYTGNVSQFKIKNTNKLFGVSYNKNILYSQSYLQMYSINSNEEANPDEDDAYAIVRQQEDNGEAPFHVAYVLLKDGLTILTIETDASRPNMKTPLFNMYTISDRKNSFHSRYNNIYLSSNGIRPITVILTKK